MYYTVYKTINLVNEHYYIGVHKTTNPNDFYLGSGERVKNAVKKYGKQNFKKEILKICETYEEAFLHEKDLVTQEMIESESCYNINEGGYGAGIQVANRLGLNNKGKDAEFFKQMSMKGKAALKEKRKDPEYDAWFRSRRHSSLGSKHSEESKAKISIAMKGKLVGASNPSFGKMWITNGTESSRIDKDENIPEGWRKGRKIH